MMDTKRVFNEMMVLIA